MPDEPQPPPPDPDPEPEDVLRMPTENLPDK